MHFKQHANDVQNYTYKHAKIDKFVKEIVFKGNLTPAQIETLLAVIDHSSVHRTYVNN